MEGNIIRKIDTTTMDDDDRISDLPDFIAHHILSFLVDYPVELIRTSVLSKRWFALTASSPILVFQVEGFSRAIDPLPDNPFLDPSPRVHFDREYVRDMFFKYVTYTTLRFSQQQNVVSANTFNLSAELEDPAHASIVDRCLGLILKQGLQVFVIFNCGINLYDGQQPPAMYRLPNILLSVSSLTYLRIHYCELPASLMAGGDDEVVKLKLLKVLYLDGIYLNEEMIKRLTAGCPLLEKLNVYRCYGFKRLCIHGHHNLQNVGVYYTSAVEEIDIQAPNLAYVVLLHMSKRDKPPCVNLFSCQKLSMIFRGCYSKLFGVSLSNFPFLETLILKLSYKYKNFKLSSHSLRKLGLETQTDLDEIKMDTPNLRYFKYVANWSNVHSPIRDSGESKTCIDCWPELDVDTNWFQKFRRFLDRTIVFKMLKLHIFGNFIDVEELKLLVSSPFELDHIELYVYNVRELSDYLSVVDAVLWCCRPRSLTLKSCLYFDDPESQNHIVKFTYEKLLEQEDQGQINIKIVFSNVKAFRSNDLLITFLKEEVSQEAGL